MKSLSYRSPAGEKPGTFAQWLRDLRNQSGCYVIRSKEIGEVFYVGESHTGRLYSTITRHFQEWRDCQEGRTCYTYSRHHVEVAIRLTPPSAAIGAQNKLINRLNPRDNSLGYAEKPF